jgi:hypothetical protein
MDQLDLTNGQALSTGQACGYHLGKAKDPCKRCGMPYRAHWPEALRPKRIRGVVAEVCSVCAYPMDSPQHVHHCGG